MWVRLFVAALALATLESTPASAWVSIRTRKPTHVASKLLLDANSENSVSAIIPPLIVSSGGSYYFGAPHSTGMALWKYDVTFTSATLVKNFTRSPCAEIGDYDCNGVTEPADTSLFQLSNSKICGDP